MPLLTHAIEANGRGAGNSGPTREAELQVFPGLGLYPIVLKFALMDPNWGPNRA